MTIADLQASGVLELLDVELARALGAMTGKADPGVELAIALTCRNVRRGHACLPLDMAASDLASTTREVGPELPEQGSWANALLESELVDGGPLVLDEKHRLYLRRYWELEHDIALELANRSGPKPSDEDHTWLPEALERLFGDDPESPYRHAAQNAMDHCVSVLCGGPGTGKTTTVAAIVALLVEGRLRQVGPAPKVLLLAPTGKAAVRLGEAVTRAKRTIDAAEQVLTSIPDAAITVHRALGMRRHGMHFSRSADSPIDADIIVLDEASMIDLGLMRQLLVAAPADATILIVGDPDQLTSVEAGSVLRDLVLASNETCWRDRVTHLTKTYRYDEAQPLGQLVAAIRAGSSAGIEELLDHQGTGEVRWRSLDDLGDELDRAAMQWSEIVNATEAEEHFRRRTQYVVLSPYRKGPIGTRQLGVAIEQRVLRVDMAVHPIIIEENNSELGVYNGDFGMLFERDGTRFATIQREPNGFQALAEARLPRYSSAYALSVHKAQGSEFDEVLIVMPEEDGPLLTRELLYTAVSRARARVRLVGPREVIAAAIRRRAQRFSGLVDQIAALAP
ncbi:MAG: exodeoxyribonuclease V subunit alpha [Myxococcales bacterium]|nr:exodeoxyribonuclease V subunit alpha [Myxococcales bacterium]